ncbi:hypothetical protein LTR62_004798 [Meristemomyces frigidus]|uniref:Uncharacterized protein n=1 Tax=Meristemomyces frigidus TaxID=1508187 RepID=A0AAN7TG17_9PEZI|nr:hypothetical protein LTR62_004798 [Meristemomyces frigidus]
MAAHAYPQERAYYYALNPRELKFKGGLDTKMVHVYEIDNLPYQGGLGTADSAASNRVSQTTPPGPSSEAITPQRTVSAIVKVYVVCNYSKLDPYETGGHVITKGRQEVSALAALNQAGCRYVPTLLTNFIVRWEDDGGIDWITRHYILMTKVPGVTMESDYSQLPRDEQQQARTAFNVAIRNVHDHGWDNGSHHSGNVIWNKGEDKCFIIDFERAHQSPLRFGSETAADWGML